MSASNSDNDEQTSDGNPSAQILKLLYGKISAPDLAAVIKLLLKYGDIGSPDDAGSDEDTDPRGAKSLPAMDAREAKLAARFPMLNRIGRGY